MDRIRDCFEVIREFKNKQASQKMRGLNDYNIVNVVRKANHEVGMHSNVIYSLINPDGLHYQGNLFLNIFIDKVLNIKDFGNIESVQAEEVTSSLDKNKRIDLTIKSNKYYIGIEMKIDHHDSKNQLFNYYEDLKNKAKTNDIPEENVIIYYLTKNGKDADKKSCNGIYYNRISFEKHILNWIDACQKEVRNITNLNEAFENYKTIVQKITKNYNSKVLNMKDFLQEDDNINFLSEVFELKNNIHKILGNTLFRLFQHIDEYISKDSKYPKIEKEMLINKQEYIYDKAKCANWFYNDEGNLKGLQKTEYIGSFYKLTDNILFRVEVATHNFHIGLVSYELNDGKYKIVNPNIELEKIAQQYKDLEYRNWRRAKWYSINCGRFISLTNENEECYKNFSTCFLKEKINNLIKFVEERNEPL